MNSLRFGIAVVGLSLVLLVVVLAPTGEPSGVGGGGLGGDGGEAADALAVPPAPTRDPAAPAGLTSDDSAAEKDQTCRWRFVKYHPSAFETKWRKGVLRYQDRICDALRTDFATENKLYMAHMDRCALDRVVGESGFPRNCSNARHQPQAPFPDEAFSKFEYALVCAAVERPEALANVTVTDDMPRRYSYIEPLAGLLRHPKACDGESHIFNKNYLVVDAWAAHRNDAFVKPGLSTSKRAGQVRSFYFDVGASVWSEGLGSSSQDWFYSTYRQRCIDFDRFHMWEVKPWKPSKVFGDIPGHLQPRYHWYNVPAGTKRGSSRNPLTHIVSEATEDDFVMLKIDIDTPVVEVPLVKQIIEDRSVSGLVDEFFFEHHVNMEVMRGPWSIDRNDPVKQLASLEIFSKLRELGIRAHSWI